MELLLFMRTLLIVNLRHASLQHLKSHEIGTWSIDFYNELLSPNATNDIRQKKEQQMNLETI